MSGKLSVKLAFGINPNIKNCLAFTEDHHLAYLCGHQIAVINTETKEQAFISATSSYQHQSLGITSFVVSLPKKIIVVAEKVEPSAIITIYDAHTLRKKRLLTYSEIGSSEIRCMAFSEDGRFMLAQGAGPDWNLVLWSLEKAAKVLCSLRISNSDETPVHHISFCPWDSAVVLVIGRGILKIFKYFEGQLRPLPLVVRRESANFISLLWLAEDGLLIGTDTGDVMFVDNFEFRGYINASLGGDEEAQPVLCMAAYRSGFVVGSSGGRLKLYERAEDVKEKYVQEDMCVLPGERPGRVTTFAVGPDEALVCATDRQQLLALTLSSLLSAKGSDGGVQHVLTSFHGPGVQGDAGITGIDVALWKNVIVTTGRDCTVRVWNAADKKTELMKTFPEEPVGLSVHPSGMYIAVAFAEKIQILSLLLEEIHMVREINARLCSGVKYAHGGHLLAAMVGSSLQLYDANTGEQQGTLRGHNSAVRSMAWMQCDSKIVTVGTEGMVYFWDLYPVIRRPEHFAGSIKISAGVGLVDGSKIFVATHDRQLKELDFNASSAASSVLSPAAALLLGRTVEASKQVPLGGYVATAMLYDESRKLLIMGTQAVDLPGAVLTTSVAGGLSKQLEVNAIHSGSVTAMCLSKDNSLLITGDSYGVLCISEFESSIPRQAKEGVSFAFIDEVLIHRAHLDGRRGQILALTQKVGELNSNHEHQLRLKDLEHVDKRTEIEDTFNVSLGVERVKYDELDAEKRTVELKFAGTVATTKSKQTGELEGINRKYKAKQAAEENRHRVLSEETNENHSRWNEENTALVQSHQKYLQELSVEYEEKLLAEQVGQRDMLHAKQRHSVVSLSLQVEIEGDGDREVAEMKIRYDAKIKQEEVTGKRLMDNHALFARSFDGLVKDSHQQKVEIKRLRDKEARLFDTISCLHNDIQSYKKEIKEREEIITDREQRMYDLKKKNQELEKFRFVLDYKIKELKLQIAPRESEINTMREQIGEMDQELSLYNKSNLALALMIEELRLKLDGVKRELGNQQVRCEVSGRLMDRFKRDLQALWATRVDSSHFKATMIKIYRVYVQEDVSAGARSAEVEDPQTVYNRDREQMERSLDTLRRYAKTEGVARKRDSGKMMRESVLLTNELNTLRKAARGMQTQQRTIEQAGELGAHTDVGELMAQLGVHVKKAVHSTTQGVGSPMGSSKSAQDLGGFVSPMGTPIKKSASNLSLSRTAALHTTNADGMESMRSPQSGKKGRQDQWEAWREIQMQYECMKTLEEKLTSTCRVLGIDAVPIIVGIDSSLL